MTEIEARSLLGIGPADGVDAEARAFRLAAKAHHPDRGGEARRLRQVVEAYRLLQARAAPAVPEPIRQDFRDGQDWHLHVARPAAPGRLCFETPVGRRTAWVSAEALGQGFLRLSEAGGAVYLHWVGAAAAAEPASESKRRRFAERWAA